MVKLYMGITYLKYWVLQCLHYLLLKLASIEVVLLGSDCILAILSLTNKNDPLVLFYFSILIHISAFITCLFQWMPNLNMSCSQVSSVCSNKSNDKHLSIFTGTKTLHSRYVSREDKALWILLHAFTLFQLESST